jgi:MSHA biogenesis protein MshP
MKNLQHGFSIVTAIFLLVVLAGLGAAMVTFSTSQSQSSAMDIMGSRAYQAARAGIEWAAYQVINNSTCPAGPTNLTSLGGTLAPFTVTVTCATTSPIVGDSITSFYSVISVACNAPNAGACPGTAGNSSYIERQISSKFGK